MLLSNQQKYILEILKEFKYLRVRQLYAPYFGRSDISDRVSSARLQRSITGRRGSRFLSTAWTLCCVNCELEQILCGFRKT